MLTSTYTSSAAAANPVPTAARRKSTSAADEGWHYYRSRRFGTDGTSRHNESLLAKARGLTHEGITAYMLTGSYEIPLHNMTGDVRRDIILINECLGIGEVALSDHRSSQPTREELEKVLTQLAWAVCFPARPALCSSTWA